MPRNPFRTGFTPGPAEGAKLTVKRLADRWQLFYETGPNAITVAEETNENFVAASKPILLAEGNPTTDELVTYPHVTTATSTGFLKRKYDQIESITVVGFGLTDIDEEYEDLEVIERLPSGFVKSPYFGLGLNYELRSIVYAIEKIANVTDIRVVRAQTGKDPVVSGKSYIIGEDNFDEIRRAIQRIHDKALKLASEDKSILANNSLLTALDPLKYPTRKRSYRKDAISVAIGKGPTKAETLSKEDQDAIVEVTKSSAPVLRRNKPEALLDLGREIEVVTLADLIERLKARLGKKSNENEWQIFFRENPFIIRLAFSIPVMAIGDQFYVGGRKFDGAGDKISDFAVKTAATGNISLIEIKTPQAELLEKSPYRPDVYAPSRELSGAVSQVLDQVYQLQRSIDNRKVNSELYDLESYAVQGLVIAGRNPDDKAKRKSFELYRNSLRSVTVITFDELVTKLEQLSELLGSPSGSPTPEGGGDPKTEE